MTLTESSGKPILDKEKVTKEWRSCINDVTKPAEQRHYQLETFEKALKFLSQKLIILVIGITLSQ